MFETGGDTSLESIPDMNDQIKARLEKIEEMRDMGVQPYAERYETTHSLGEAGHLSDDTGNVSVAGRVVSIRYFGKLAFGHLFGSSGKLQFALQKKVLEERFAEFKKFVDIGDFIGIRGSMMTTRTGEKTINTEEWSILSKSLRPLPEKFHGLSDPDARLRQRYLDLVMNTEVMERFKKRTKIVSSLRNFLNQNDFMEIDTPVLTNKASGALANPFVTHNNALDIDVFLRIAPETYLKRAVAGGFERVYEFARSFRNEGVDASHLPDFTLLEYYCAYWNYKDNMDFTERLMKNLLKEVNGGLELEYMDSVISFEGEWPRVSFRELLIKDCGIDIDEHSDREGLLRAIDNKGIKFDDDVDVESAGRGSLIDLLYKKVSRPGLKDPVFITHHPLDLSPLARKSDDNPDVVDRFQLVINGWEVINAYSELVDPLDQRERFRQQAEAREHGDKETMDIDEDFIRCMEYGMPPISGWGMGLDRIVALLTNAPTLRDVVLFPLLRPEHT